jgi:hypothetical protein
MSIDLKGMDGKKHTFSSADLLNKYRSDSDVNGVKVQLLASIGTELENITELLEALVND